jgi:anti-anti-sigma regulatory factor
MKQLQTLPHPDLMTESDNMRIEQIDRLAIMHAGPSLTVRQYTINQMMLLTTIANAARVELDLSRVVDLDADGVQWLIMAKRLTLARGRGWHLRALSPAVHELLTVCGLTDYFAEPQCATEPDWPGVAGPAPHDR